MKWGYIIAVMLLVLISGCVPSDKTVQELNQVTGQPVLSVQEGDDQYALPIPENILTPPAVGSIPFLVADNCESFDTASFDVAGCQNSCDSNSYHVKRIVNGVSAEFSDCSRQGQVCCINKNLYALQNCKVTGDPGLGDEYPFCTLLAYWDSTSPMMEDLKNCDLKYAEINDPEEYNSDYDNDGIKNGLDDDGGCISDPLISPYCWMGGNPRVQVMPRPNGIADYYDGTIGYCSRQMGLNSLGCNQAGFMYASCLTTNFFCSRYTNAYCEDDTMCNKQTIQTCTLDPDCGDSPEQRQIFCNSACFANWGVVNNRATKSLTTCVQRLPETSSCQDTALDYNGIQHQRGYWADLTLLSNSNDNLGCEAFGEDYDCCLINPYENSKVMHMVPWQVAYYYDKQICPKVGSDSSTGTLKNIPITCAWKNLTTAIDYNNYPCYGTPCMDKIIAGTATTVDYQKCFSCGESCGIGECCNDIDDDGDGKIDTQDTKCKGNYGGTEGGVCFA